MTRWRNQLPGEAVLLVAVAALLLAGGILWLSRTPGSGGCWAAATAVALAPALWWVAEDLRHRRWGADSLAVLALASTLAVGEFLAGAVVAVMVATGRVLESRAQRRAARDLTALLDRVPQTVHVRSGDDLREIPAGEVAAGNTVVVLPGEVVPVDGKLPAAGVFDESALTGEPLPVARPAGDAVRSGVVNATPPWRSRRRRARTRALTPEWCGWRSRRQRRARPLPGWRIGPRSISCPPRC